MLHRIFGDREDNADVDLHFDLHRHSLVRLLLEPRVPFTASARESLNVHAVGSGGGLFHPRKGADGEEDPIIFVTIRPCLRVFSYYVACAN